MLTFTVHEPPSPPADRLERAESLVFIKDGFSWAAALFGPVWLLVHRLWWALLGYVVICAGMEAVRWAVGLDAGWVTVGALGLALLIGLEASTLRRWKLDGQGWRMIGSVSGRNAPECERRFFEEWLPKQPAVPPPLPKLSPGGSPPRRAPIIGSLLGARS